MNADVHALAGAYALDALPPEEAAAFADHMAACAACRQEVAELQTTAAQLGLRLAEAPPAGLRDRVLRSARATRQIPPSAPAGDLSIDIATRRRHRRSRLLAVAAAAVIVAAGALTLPRVLDDETGPANRDLVAAVMNAPDAHSSTARVRGGGVLTVVSSHRLDRAVVLSERLPAAHDHRVYQLWLVDRDGHPRSADVLIEHADGRSRSTDVIHGLRPGDTVAITREPAGGSRTPSMTPLATVERV